MQIGPARRYALQDAKARGRCAPVVGDEEELQVTARIVG